MREAVITVLLTSSLMCGATEDHTQFKLQKGTHKPVYPWKTVKFQSVFFCLSTSGWWGGWNLYPAETLQTGCRWANTDRQTFTLTVSLESPVNLTPSVWLEVEYLESLQRKAPDWIRISKTKWWMCDECPLSVYYQRFFFFCCGDHRDRSSASIWPDP